MSVTARRLHIPIIAAILVMTVPGLGAFAQSVGLGNSKQPIEILADQGIEWDRVQQRYIARGNASAKQGTTTVYGDVLTAYYRPQPQAAGAAAPANDAQTPGGGTQIFRYEVQGHVRIVTPTQTAVGDKGVYDIDTGVLVLTGHGLKLTTPTETVTARDSLEYWENKRMAVARGDAVVVTEDRRMTGDLLTAYFVDSRTHPAPAQARNRQPAGARPGVRPAATGKADDQTNRLQRIEGFGNVHVSTATDIVRADRGVYNADTGIALMSDHVRITRGQNQLDGDFAEVNLNTGISRLLTRPDGSKQQVRALFVPENTGDDQTKKPGTPKAPAAQAPKKKKETQ